MNSRRTFLLLLTVTIALLSPLGCDKSDHGAGGDGKSGLSIPEIDLSKIEAAFSSATGAIKVEWDSIKAAIKSTDYAGALASIKSLAKNVELSEGQKAALAQLLEQVKAQAGDFWKDATDAAGKAVDKATDAAEKAAEKVTDATKDLLPK